MSNLKCRFAGLELKNPIIVSSCSLTNDARSCKKFEEAGVAAVVLKSLFEENIICKSEQMSDDSLHAESADYLQGYLRAQILQEYIQLVKESKKLCSIPVIASICCRTKGEWTEFATLIEEAGADALELNVMSVCTVKNYTYGSFEQKHIDILNAVKKAVKIPVIMKLGSNLSNPVALIDRLYSYGAAAVVLFNRPYQTDINIDKLEYSTGSVLSNESDLSNALRWTGIASAVVKNISYAVSGGVLTGEAVVKALLAGASAVEVSSALYKEGAKWIGSALDFLAKWQGEHGFASVEDFCGKLNAKDPEREDVLERTQFLKFFEAFSEK